MASIRKFRARRTTWRVRTCAARLWSRAHLTSGGDIMSAIAARATRKPRLVGMNHIALEVGDVEAAPAFYGRLFEFTLRGGSLGQAFIDMGDEFIALMAAPAPHKEAARHVGGV